MKTGHNQTKELKPFEVARRRKISLNEEKIIKLIIEVFEEECKKQEVNIMTIISSNFTLTIKEMKSLKQEVNDLKKNIEFTQNYLEEKIADVEKKISTFEIKVNEMYHYQIDLDYVNDSLSELQETISEMENRSRRNNVRVHGVTEEKGETWEDCENKVLEILRDEIEIEDVTIERAHRVKPCQNEKNNKGKDSSRTTVCKLPYYKDKTQILQKCHHLTGTSYYINEDFI